MPIVGGPRVTLATLATAEGLAAGTLIPTSGTYLGKKIYAATFQPKTANVYVCWDGAAATATDLLLVVGDILRLEGYENLVKFSAYDAGNTATLLVLPEYRV